MKHNYFQINPDFDLTDLSNKSQEIRASTLNMIAKVGMGHPGSSLSSIEILTCLYYKVMNFRIDDLQWRRRDRFILSKGHGAPALYSILIDLGIVPPNESKTLRQLNSMLQGHPDIRFTKGLEASSGSLGQGLSIGLGIALAMKKKKMNSNVFVLLGDGECQEGQIWEAAMAAGHLNLNNIYAIVDYNGIQHDGFLKDILDLYPLADKWKAFGWEVKEIDGHHCEAILNSLTPNDNNKPTAVIAHTIKGKGVDYMENKWEWHSVADAQRMANDFREL